jgi:hypothetical protein
MQSSSFLSLIVSGSADQYVQELVREAERSALIKEARGQRPSVIESMRLAIGHAMVGMGRKVAGRPRRQSRALDAPAAFKIAR